MSQQTRNKLQDAIDAHVADEYGSLAMARDWVLSAHVISIDDVNEDTGHLAIYKGAQTSVFTATGILTVANDTYRADDFDEYEEGTEDDG